MRTAAALGKSNIFELTAKPGGGLSMPFSVMDSTLATDNQSHLSHLIT